MLFVENQRLISNENDRHENVYLKRDVFVVKDTKSVVKKKKTKLQFTTNDTAIASGAVTTVYRNSERKSASAFERNVYYSPRSRRSNRISCTSTGWCASRVSRPTWPGRSARSPPSSHPFVHCVWRVRVENPCNLKRTDCRDGRIRRHCPPRPHRADDVFA